MFNSNRAKDLTILTPVGISGSHGVLVAPNVARDIEQEVEIATMKTYAPDHPSKRLSVWRLGDAKTLLEWQM